MKNIFKVLLALLILVVMPILVGIIVVGAFRYNNSVLLIILFFSLIALSVTLSVIRFIKYNKRDKEE